VIANATVEHCEFPGGYRPDANPGECTFDAAAARQAIDFFPTFLRFIKGRRFANQPFILQPWQADIVGTLFGWKRPDGTRRYRFAHIEIPRKNGKSTLAMGLALLLLFLDGEPGAEIVGAASTREQAGIVYNLAKQNVERCNALSARATTFKNYIEYRNSTGAVDGTYKATSSEAGTHHGGDLSGVIADELHVWPKRELFDVLKTSFGSRDNPLFVTITTAGFDRQSICWEEHEYACRIRDNEVPATDFLPVLYFAEDDDDWTDPKVWAKCNPNLGVSRNIDELHALCERAQASPAIENTFRQLYLNQWTEQAVRWLSMKKWNACGEEPMPDLQGAVCYAGLDMSTSHDLTAFTLLFPLDGGRYAVLPICWVPEERAREREKNDRVPYMTWARQGHLETTPTASIDQEFVAKRIVELNDVYNIQSVALDRWNAGWISQKLQDSGLDVVEFGQGMKDMTQPTKELDRLVREGLLVHAMHPVLRWCASNIAVRRDAADNWKPDKEKSTERIDPMVATIMALGLAMSGPTESVYEERGLMVL
jgi:phage terminase large subunit-like protein